MDDQNPFQDPRAEADVMRLIRQSYGPRQKYEPPFQCRVIN
jgi:cytochrome c-type biogenesis protein CcmH/NrfF